MRQYTLGRNHVNAVHVARVFSKVAIANSLENTHQGEPLSINAVHVARVLF